MVNWALLLLLWIARASTESDSVYTLVGNTAVVTTGCRWEDINGTPVDESERVVGVTYVCQTTQSGIQSDGPVGSIETGLCQYWCSKETMSTFTIYGKSTFTADTFRTVSLDNPYMLGPPKGCHELAFKCDDVVDPVQPLNDISIKLYGTSELQDYVFKGVTCENTLKCAIGGLLTALAKDSIPEDWMVDIVRGTTYSCIMTYLGVGVTQSDTPCWRQLGARCYLSLNQTRYCISSDVKTEGLTDFGSPLLTPELWCGYDHSSQYRYGAFQMPIYMPDQYSKCTGVLYNKVGMVDNKVTKDPRYNKESVICALSERRDPMDIKNLLAKNPTLLMVVNGNGDSKWTSVLSSPKTLETFTKSCLDIMRKYKFKGIVLDWEPPRDTNRSVEMDNFKKLSESFAGQMTDKKNTILATTVATQYPWNNRYDIGHSQRYFDKVFMKTYDLSNPNNLQGERCHTAWDIGSNCGINKLKCQTRQQYHYLRYAVEFFQRHVPVNKLSFGLAFFGNVFEQVDGKFQLPDSSLGVQLNTPGRVGYAVTRGDEAHYTCKVNDLQQCCQSTFIKDKKTYYASWDNVETHKSKIQKVFDGYGIVSFFSNSLDMEPLDSEQYDHEILRVYINNLGNVPVQKTAIPVPSYQIGTGPLIICPGIVATMGKLIFSQTSYAEFTKLNSFSNLYVADVTRIKGCVAGAVPKFAVLTDDVPKQAVALNTYLPTTDPLDHSVGLNADNQLVEFIPKVTSSCVSNNKDALVRLNYIEVDSEFYFTEPEVRETFILIPQGIRYYMTNYSMGVEYLNFDTVCINYQIGSLPTCINVACNGDPGCIQKYPEICSQAEMIIADTRRSNQMLLDAFADLEIEHTKARVYTPYVDPAEPKAETKFAGIIIASAAAATAAVALGTATAALVIANDVANRVDIMERQMVETQAVFNQMSGNVVVLSSKLDRNTAAVNERIGQIQEGVNKQFMIIDNNFKSLSGDIDKLASVNEERFRLTLGYQSWYQLMVGLTNQLTQAALQMTYKTSNIRSCFKSLVANTMASCPSGLKPFIEHPGLAHLPTVKAMMYHKKKLLIVNRIPNTFTPFTLHKAIPKPIVVKGEICWFDYDLSYVDGKLYNVHTCTGPYCEDPTENLAWEACTANSSKCRYVCGDCFKDTCYDKTTQHVTYNQGETIVHMEIGNLEELVSLPRALDIDRIVGESLRRNSLEDIGGVNIQLKLESIREDLTNINKTMDEYNKVMALLSLGGTSYARTAIIIMVVIIVILVICGVIYCIIRSRGNQQNRYYDRPQTYVHSEDYDSDNGGPSRRYRRSLHY
nr:membrane glycoprotein [Salmonid herpesvirus 1]